MFNNSKGFMDVIRCDEPDYLIWKWHPSGTSAGNNAHENAIRYGSSLRVKDGEAAVLVYNQKNGIFQDFIEGPFDQTIKTANLPILASIVGLAYGGSSPFQAEIYYINLAKIIQTKFAVPFFDVYDPRFTDFGVPVAVRGTISFKIADYREFIKLHRLINFDLNQFQTQIKDAVIRYVKNVVANAPGTHNIPLVQIETQISRITDAVESAIDGRLKENFGVQVLGVDISSIEFDKTSTGYQQLMTVTKDITTIKIKAETEDYVEKLRIQREEGQYAMHKQTQTANIGAYQVEKQADVGIAGANALGQMGANGAGGVDLGGGAGFNPAAMMAGIAVGGSVGQNIVGAMNGIMTGNPSQFQTPPPITKTVYNVAINGQSTGPYEISSLEQMAQAGEIDGSTLVWKPGMDRWTEISYVDELSQILNAIPPQLD